MTHHISSSVQWKIILAVTLAMACWRLGLVGAVGGSLANVPVVAVILVAFFVHDALLFAAGMVVVVAGTLYVPWFQWEYVWLVAIGCFGFLLTRQLVFERNFFLFLLAVAVADMLWWIGTGYGIAMVTGPLFIYELFYTSVAAGILFFVTIWLEGIF